MRRRQSLQVARSEVREDGVPREVADSPLYGVAMLKIAMELKKPRAGALEEIIKGVLSRMHLEEGEFRAYLSQNSGLLRAIAERRRY